MGLMRLLRGDVLTEEELAAARAEGAQVLVERARCVLRYDDYRAPGKIHKGKKTLTSGGVLITPTKVSVWGGGVRHFDLPRTAVPTPALSATAEGDVLTLVWRAESFHADRTGQVDLRLTTPDAALIAQLLTAAPQ